MSKEKITMAELLYRAADYTVDPQRNINLPKKSLLAVTILVEVDKDGNSRFQDMTVMKL